MAQAKTLNKSELKQLLDVTNSCSRYPLRDSTMLLFTHLCGLRVGEVAALTYLLNPLMLYHTDFLWFNPAPFVFFFFAGFYMLIRGKRLTGTLLIVCAALFKQTAYFCGSLDQNIELYKFEI